MPTRASKYPQQAIEQACEVISVADYLATHPVIRRHDELGLAVRRLRHHAERSNSYVCRAWLRSDTLSDLPDDAA